MTDIKLCHSDKNRLLAAFHGQKADRVPNFEVLVENPTFSHVMGRKMEARHTLANIPPADYIQFARRIGQDAVGMCFYDNPFCLAAGTNSIQLPITSKNILDAMPDFNLAHLEERFKQLSDYEQAVKGTELGLFALTGDFFCSTYTNVLGFENFMCQLYDDRDLVESLLDRLADHNAAITRRLVEYDLLFLYIGDDIAFKSSTLIHPDLMRELWIPRMKRVFAPALEKGIPILFHSDGNIEALIPDLIEMGISALNPIEPYGMDIRAIKKRFGNNLTLVGNLDVGGCLSYGTQDDVRSEAKALIDDVGRDGGYVLASCHSISSNVKPENFLAMVETAQTYGAY